MVQRAPHLPPIPAPFRPNLLSSVSPEPRPTEGRWVEGINYTPVKYTSGWSFDPCGAVGEGSKPESANSPDLVEWDPYWIGDDVTCSTMGDRDEITRLLREAFNFKTSHLIEEVLWTNTVDSADFGAGHPNVSISDASLGENSSGATGSIYVPNGYVSYPIVTAWRQMIEALTLQLGGARGMIHVEARILPDIAYAGLAVQNGGRLTTTLGDHIVVPGTGYTGSAPDGAAPGDFHSWIYGTSMVEVLLAEPMLVGDGAEIIDRSTNQVTARMEQLALAHWDRQAHVGISVCLEDPYGDCSDSGS